MGLTGPGVPSPQRWLATWRLEKTFLTRSRTPNGSWRQRLRKHRAWARDWDLSFEGAFFYNPEAQRGIPMRTMNFGLCTANGTPVVETCTSGIGGCDMDPSLRFGIVEKS